MIETNKIDEEQLVGLRERGFTADTVYADGRWEELKMRLLGYGGEAVILAYNDPDHPKMTARGVFYSGVVELRKGKFENVHKNITQESFNDVKVKIWTGYALSKDGIWRQHSWGKSGDIVVESYEPKVAYFGFEMTYDEENDFVFSQV